MLILAKVNGYYSRYSPQTIMEEEARCRYSDVFTLAKKEFFRHRLLKLYPRINDKSIATSVNFLAQQKMGNCPCFVHTEQRGIEWIVFRRQTDRVNCDCDDIPDMEDDPTNDEDFFIVEADEITTAADSPQNNTSNEDPDHAETQQYPSLHSRDNNKISQKEKNEQEKMNDHNEEDPMDFDDNKGDGVMYKKSKGYSYYPLIFYKK